MIEKDVVVALSPKNGFMGMVVACAENGLLLKMNEIGADSDLVQWTGSFMTERRVSLVIDSHHCDLAEGRQEDHWVHRFLPYYLQYT